MAVIRLILLVAVLGGLTLLLVQNWSPVLPLVFLGMRTQPLPLAMWILFSIATGAFTSVLISALFKLSNYFGGQQRQTPLKSGTASPRARAARREEPIPPPSSPPPRASRTEYAASDASEEFDDWETSNNTDDDWNLDDKPTETPTPNPKTQPFQDSQTYERQQEPKSGSQSGSVYSYSYREPKNTAVGKTESVYDADYRVIIPPYQPPASNQADNSDDDDWEFFEDDDFEDEDKPSRP
ncbi:LapA family protein [Nostocaceae cyanobacterium CENA357]|uniref:LapA family protein n=1 Tax=Atlanticothrix silvestris CENA357 TaxID=1725252 RepID=A0A8J7HL42_9CYAN|nr:LapA family protein [Atlanticothrix silvestris]MBH8555124.1 LapA family protein [Atlanticothrix silvestris CENA357]